jgi:cell division septal protein FtsQ
VLKLYPDRLLITITERRAFALWQHNAHVNVIADDGTVLQPFVEDRYRGLPLVVGSGAERRAKNFIGLLDRYPAIRSAVRAAVLVAERRWNLRLTNGMDVRLPEGDLQTALDRLVKLDNDKKLLSRDITSIDLRLADRAPAPQHRGRRARRRLEQSRLPDWPASSAWPATSTHPPQPFRRVDRLRAHSRARDQGGHGGQLGPGGGRDPPRGRCG